MSVLGRIRQNIALIAIIIFIALLAFVLTDFIRGLTGILGGPPVAGEVAGETVTWQEYQTEVSNVLQQQGGVTDPVREGQLRDDVWNNLVMRKLYRKEFDNIGIEVTEKELTEMFIGSHVDPTYLQAPIFKDSLGNFSPQRVQQWYQYMAENNPEVLVSEEDRLELNRSFQKYFNMLQGAFYTSDAAAKEIYKNQNKKVTISYLSVPFSAVSDSAVTVTQSDLNNYLKENKHQYEQEDETIIRFSKFTILPNKRDSMKAFNGVNKLRNNFAETRNDSTYTIPRSTQPYFENFVSLSQLPEQLRDSIKDASEKDIFGPFLIGGSYRLFKLVQKQEAEESYGKVAHIQVSFGRDTAAAETKARGLLRDARRGDFAEVARENSEDFGSRNKGGEIGWYPQNAYGSDFDDAVSRASVGSIIGPIKGNSGYHIIKVLDKNDKQYDVAQIEDAIIYTTATKDSVYGLANRFAKRLFELGDINATAAEQNVIAAESNSLTDESRIIQGLRGGRELILWALNAEVSDYTNKVFRIEDDYVLAQVTKKTEKGLQALDDVRADVERKVLNEKKAEYLVSQINGLSGQELESIKNSIGNGSQTGVSKDLTFASNAVTGVGIEPNVVGRAFSLAQGETSQPVIGNNGVYLIKVDAITEANEPDDAAVASLKTQLESNLRRVVLEQPDNLTRRNKLENALREINGVVDSRAKAEARNYGY